MSSTTCRGRAARPDVSHYRRPEKWLFNLFEDALKETLETTRLPCNVSKINDCMRRLDPTYRLDETGMFYKHVADMLVFVFSCRRHVCYLVCVYIVFLQGSSSGMLQLQLAQPICPSFCPFDVL